MFGLILISVITLLHVYVIWRITSVPFLKRLFPIKYIICIGILLWALFCAGIIYGHHGTNNLAWVLEFVGMNWMATLFLIFVLLLLVECISGFGFLLPRLAPSLRGLALIAGGVLSLIALGQGLRSPVIENYKVTIPGLPAELDGTVIVAMSDLHIGLLLNRQWLQKRIAQVQAEQPDLVVLLGDLFEGHGPPLNELLPTLRSLKAPLGVWAVNGNHEHYGQYRSAALLKGAGIQLMRNKWSEVRPGLVLAGIEDLTIHRRLGKENDLISETLDGSPAGATVLLSHTPWEYERAAQAGVNLMLSGHTHGGQIWPFGYITKQFYPLIAGSYEVGKMTLIVCRGTGTWGPRMRLWLPGEIMRITLLSED